MSKQTKQLFSSQSIQRKFIMPCSVNEDNHSDRVLPPFIVLSPIRKNFVKPVLIRAVLPRTTPRNQTYRLVSLLTILKLNSTPFLTIQVPKLRAK